MYKLPKVLEGWSLRSVIKVSENAAIPFDPANTDYANFKKEVLEGAELQDSDGVVMSADAAKEFVNNLA